MYMELYKDRVCVYLCTLLVFFFYLKNSFHKIGSVFWVLYCCG